MRSDSLGQIPHPLRTKTIMQSIKQLSESENMLCPQVGGTTRATKKASKFRRYELYKKIPEWRIDYIKISHVRTAKIRILKVNIREEQIWELSHYKPKLGLIANEVITNWSQHNIPPSVCLICTRRVN